MTKTKPKINQLVRTTLELEQYECRNCGKLFYIEKLTKGGLDFDFGCPWGCDDNGKHMRDIKAEIKEVKDIR